MIYTVERFTTWPDSSNWNTGKICIAGNVVWERTNEILKGLRLDIAGQQQKNMLLRKQETMLSVCERHATAQLDYVESLKDQQVALIASIDDNAQQARCGRNCSLYTFGLV